MEAGPAQALFPSRRLVADAPLLPRERAGLLQVVPACQETRGLREPPICRAWRHQRPAPRPAACRRSSCDALSRPPNVGNRGEHSRTRRYVPETNGAVERFNRTIGVRAPLPPRDRQHGRARRGGRCLPRALQRGQAASDTGARATARRAPRRSTPISGTKSPTSLTRDMRRRCCRRREARRCRRGRWSAW
jgi:hypothetical protein